MASMRIYDQLVDYYDKEWKDEDCTRQKADLKILRDSIDLIECTFDDCDMTPEWTPGYNNVCVLGGNIWMPWKYEDKDGFALDFKFILTVEDGFPRLIPTQVYGVTYPLKGRLMSVETLRRFSGELDTAISILRNFFNDDEIGRLLPLHEHGIADFYMVMEFIKDVAVAVRGGSAAMLNTAVDKYRTNRALSVLITY